MTENPSQHSANQQNQPGGGRLTIQRIHLRKQQAREWTQQRKLEKIAAYSSCKVSNKKFSMLCCAAFQFTL